MKAKQIITVLLLVFVAGSIAYMIGKETTAEQAANEQTDETTENYRRETASQNEAVTDEAEQKSQVIVYYFHGNVRCATCNRLESYAKETLDTYFTDELADGKIIWKPVNVDEPQNRHFIEDYSLVTKSVILSEVAGGKEVNWKNLDRIWQEVSDKQGYIRYIHDSVSEFSEDKE